jgi:polysaccharide biosynthesis protein PslH
MRDWARLDSRHSTPSRPEVLRSENRGRPLGPRSRAITFLPWLDPDRMNERLRILWVTLKWPLPATDGARVATESLVRSVVGAGAHVDVLAFCGHAEVVDAAAMRSQWSVDRITVCRRYAPTTRLRKLLFFAGAVARSPSMPATYATYATPALRRQFDEVLATNQYDVVVLDGTHLGAMLLRGDTLDRPAGAARLVLRAHNVESDLWQRSVKLARDPVRRLLLRWQFRNVARVERLIVRGVDAIAAIAEEDAQVFREWTSRPVKWVPLGLDFSDPVPVDAGAQDRFLFIGRLDWPPNADALRWMLTEVWPAVQQRRPAARLKIVGSGDSRWLQPYRALPGVEFVGFVERTRDAYRDCAFTVVPISYGSGTRIKVVEAFAMRRTLISTAMAVQGSGVDETMYCRAETAEEWIELLSTIQSSEESESVLARAHALMAETFGMHAIGQRAVAWFRSLQRAG